jgi:hypothetical protein
MGGALTFMSASIGVTGVYNSVSARSSINACAQQTIETSACDTYQISKYSRQAEITASEMMFPLGIGGMGAGFIMMGAAASGRRRRG